jgi:hypothetical protein
MPPYPPMCLQAYVCDNLAFAADLFSVIVTHLTYLLELLEAKTEKNNFHHLWIKD